MGGWMDGWMDCMTGWIDRWMGGRVGAWIDG